MKYLVLPLILLAACVGGGSGEPSDRPISESVNEMPAQAGEKVYIPFGHIHSEECGHYFRNGSWYFLPGHFHREGCGHHYYAFRWNAFEPADDSHRHDSYCGHYFYHGGWYHAEGHIHGDECGHLYRDGMFYLDR
jgi:hypothetical protein